MHVLRHQRCVFTAIALAVIAPRAVGQAEPDDLRRDYERLSRAYQLAAPDWRPEPPATGTLLYIAPDQYSGPALAAEPSADRSEYANKLFELARRAADAGQLSLAYQWATEAVRENPDHAEARRVLGYEQRDGIWLTDYGARMADAGKAWHPKFGWLEPGDVSRYEAGERRLGNRWISAKADAARHDDIKTGWQIRTDHFVVKTNHSLEAAADLAARLERLHQVWRQLYAGFYLSEREVRELFAGDRLAGNQVRPFRVFYHKDRDQYSASLRRRQPRIAETLGIYFDTNREAHFFLSDEDQNLATLYHEVVHQLFHESRSAAKHVGELANFWIVEGVATYFETLTEHVDGPAGRYYTIGEASAGRLPAARERLLDGYYVSFAELTPLGKHELQRRPDLAKLYSQAAGMTAFLMDGAGGRYREPLVAYLGTVYAGRDNAKSLADATQSRYDYLDAQYRHFMESLP